MKLTDRRQTVVAVCVFAAWILLVGHAFAGTESMNCDGTMPPRHFELVQGDQNSGNHLQFSRKVASAAQIDVDVCSADLTIVGSKSDQLEVTLDVATPAPKTTAADYVQALDITPDGVQLQLRLPKHASARVLIAVPAATSQLAVNLVHGDLSFQTDRIGGERKINVVHGHVDVEANTDSYATMHVDTVMGSFHDRRLGHAAHGVVSQSLSGNGKGSIEVNVVWGSVDLKPWD